jgi:hypothetical protein
MWRRFRGDCVGHAVPRCTRRLNASERLWNEIGKPQVGNH